MSNRFIQRFNFSSVLYVTRSATNHLDGLVVHPPLQIVTPAKVRVSYLYVFFVCLLSSFVSYTRPLDWKTIFIMNNYRFRLYYTVVSETVSLLLYLFLYFRRKVANIECILWTETMRRTVSLWFNLLSYESFLFYLHLNTVVENT